MLNKAVIDLGKIKSNAIKVKQKLKKGVKFNAVVKADGYGHGAEMVARSLYKITDSFSVALLEEAVSLRLSGIDKEILCLIPFDESETDKAIHYGITATVSNVEHIKALGVSAKRLQKNAYVHVKFNTGMNRQGVDSVEKLTELIKFCHQFKEIKVSGLYSHFATPENKNALKYQLDKFLLANKLIKGYNNNVTCHISASGGFLSGVQLDMVRIGILLYGYKPFESSLIQVNPAMQIFAPIVDKRRLKVGEHALYGDKRAERETQFNLVRYGYADGLFRKEIDGQFNNRCMDLSAMCGEMVTEFGYPVMTNADILAKRYDTISYEILTKASLRAEKIYLY